MKKRKIIIISIVSIAVVVIVCLILKNLNKTNNNSIVNTPIEMVDADTSEVTYNFENIQKIYDESIKKCKSYKIVNDDYSIQMQSGKFKCVKFDIESENISVSMFKVKNNIYILYQDKYYSIPIEEINQNILSIFVFDELNKSELSNMTFDDNCKVVNKQEYIIVSNPNFGDFYFVNNQLQYIKYEQNVELCLYLFEDEIYSELPKEFDNAESITAKECDSLLYFLNVE